jgi:hypothetical protein
MNALNCIELDISGMTLQGYDNGTRWNGFAVPLFRASQIDVITSILCNADYDEYFEPKFELTTFTDSITGESLYIIEEGFCFDIL